MASIVTYIGKEFDGDVVGKPILPKSNIGEMKAVKREAKDGYRESKTHYFWIKAINEVRSGARYKPIKLCL